MPKAKPEFKTPPDWFNYGTPVEYIGHMTEYHGLPAVLAERAMGPEEYFCYVESTEFQVGNEGRKQWRFLVSAHDVRPVK